VAQLKGQLDAAQARHGDEEAKGAKLRQELQKAKGKIVTLTGGEQQCSLIAALTAAGACWALHTPWEMAVAQPLQSHATYGFIQML
jgi:hypothetical protein